MFDIAIKAADGASLPECQFQQSDFWTAFKARHGWSQRCLSVSVRKAGSGGEPSVFSCSVLVRTFGRAPFAASIAYIPMAPECSCVPGCAADPGAAPSCVDSYAVFLEEFAARCMEFLPRGTLCVRYDVPVDFSSCAERDAYVDSVKNLALADGMRLRKSEVDIQPPDTTVVDLTRPLEAVLDGMKPKWRYNVRLAARKGVSVRALRAGEPEFDSYFDSFYRLFKETAERDGIAVHTRQYCRDLLECSAERRRADASAPDAALYVAEHGGGRIAGIITLVSGREAVYLYGASGNEKRNLMPAYLLQWTAMQDAKGAGAERYDLYGMPPEDDEGHPMHGLYRFKTGFGGALVHRPGTFDVPVGALYPLYVAAERFRAFWHKKILKKIRGR